jgi:hypothetical protein
VGTGYHVQLNMQTLPPDGGPLLPPKTSAGSGPEKPSGAKPYANDQITYQPNGDAGAHYDFCFSLCNTGSLTGGGGSGAAGTTGNLCYLPGTGGPSGNAGISTTKFIGYAQTSFRKQATSKGGWYNPSNALWTINMWNQWRSTAAITSLVLALGSGANFLAGSTFTLYGEL